MTEQSKNEQEYIQHVVNLFLKDPNTTELDDITKLLVQKITTAERTIANLREQINRIRETIVKENEKIFNLDREIVHKQGESQGAMSTLLDLRSKEQENSAGE